MHKGTVDANRFGQIGAVVGGGQILQVVTQHLGSDILHHRLLRQARDGPQVEAVLEPLECLLNTPALVVQVTERTSRKRATSNRLVINTCTIAKKREKRVCCPMNKKIIG